jgi:protein-L-isoaspartate(D-aspartate) O-methyltransferase
MDFRNLRNKMVTEQIASRGITDPGVLEALRRVYRHEFVPNELQHKAYEDCPIPIGDGQTISQPYMVALMTQCLALNKNKCALEIGTGSGYQTAILAELCKEVYSIECVTALAEQAKRRLERMDYSNIHIRIGDGTLGWPAMPQFFEAIIITAASPGKPEHLLSQLAPDGRLAAPLGDRYSQMLTLFTKIKDGFTEESICACTFVPLIGRHGWCS